MSIKNSNTTIVESWFIPLDILSIICTILVIVLTILFSFIIIFDKTCHTVAMMLIMHSCLAELILGIDLLSTSVFTLQNDLKQIQYEDSFCAFRGYFGFVACAIQNYSYFLQSIYRYITIIYPNRLFWQTRRTQIYLIGLIWIFSFLCPIPFLFTNEIIYNVNNQICQLPLRLSFSLIFVASSIYIFPNLLVMFTYFKLVGY